MTAQCPECGYTFSDKGDFKLYQIGEIIQCPVCKTELRVNKNQELEVLDF